MSRAARSTAAGHKEIAQKLASRDLCGSLGSRSRAVGGKAHSRESRRRKEGNRPCTAAFRPVTLILTPNLYRETPWTKK